MDMRFNVPLDEYDFDEITTQFRRVFGDIALITEWRWVDPPDDKHDGHIEAVIRFHYDSSAKVFSYRSVGQEGLIEGLWHWMGYRRSEQAKFVGWI